MPGGVRVRDTQEDLLTALYWANKITDEQFSAGVSFQKDLWQASILAPKASNVEATSKTAHYGNLPGSLASLARVNQAMRHVSREYGGRAAQVLIRAAQGGAVTGAELQQLSGALIALNRFYSLPSPRTLMSGILGVSR